MEFTHLHVHSHYSMLDGGNRIRDLARAAAQQGMKSLALTDHGNLFGAIDFYRTAEEEGVRPILGMEAYIAPGSRFDRKSTQGGADVQAHLLLLAMNETGWNNLIRLSTKAYLEGFYYKPRLDRELLQSYGQGLVCTSACLGGEIPQALLKGDREAARRIGGEYRELFGRDRFFIEIQNQGVEEQARINPDLADLARHLQVGIVGTNDVHFLRREHKRAHHALTCIAVGKTVDEPSKMEYTPEMYLKSPAEMAEAFSAFPEAFRNTQVISEMCRVKLDLTRKHLPVFQTPEGIPPDQYLRTAAREGLARRFNGAEPPQAYLQRLDRELEVIRQKGYSSYFLIVNDFVQFARRHDIPAGPRGSGVATLIGYSLGITDVDPLRYGLLFERFTDPQRQEDPDIDIDICQEGRDRVIQYVREKYVHVAQIITYGTLKAKAVFRDVSRVLNLPLDEVNRLMKLVPEDSKLPFDKMIQSNEELRALCGDPQSRVREVAEIGAVLENLARNPSVHASAVVVCDQPLEGLVPLCRVSDSEDVITQWDGPTCEKAGLMKMDLLGLKTLTVIQRAREMVRARTGRDIDPEAIPMDDPRVFALFCQGETDGVFQFESPGMKSSLQDIQPNKVEDLIAVNAMYRPGPMEFIATYGQRKRGEQPVEKIHPLVDDILEETYGILVYQEQVMQVVNRLGNIPLGRAMTLIKSISKKKEKQIESERAAFLEGARANGLSAAEGKRVFDLILKFAGYGFNKAHATRYSIVAYQTAYFKAYYPLEFWAATLSYEVNAPDKLVHYIKAARLSGCEVAPPDINTCDRLFAVVDGRVRFGLMAVKGVGEAAVNAVIAARKAEGGFRDLFHFCRSVDLRAVNRLSVEALVKSGAFDSVSGGRNRGQLFAAIEAAVLSGQAAGRDREAGQMSLFGGAVGGVEHAVDRYPDRPVWSRSEILAEEKKSLGFYVTAHPLDDYLPEIRGLNWPPEFQLDRLTRLEPNRTGVVCGMVTGLKPLIVKTGKSAGRRMARFMLEDLSGRCEVVAFADVYESQGPILQNDALVCLVVTPSSRDSSNLVLQDASALDTAGEKRGAGLLLELSEEVQRDPGRRQRIMDLLKKHAPGTVPVHFQMLREGFEPVSFRASPDWKIRASRPLLVELGEILGSHRIRWIGREPPARESRNGYARSGARPNEYPA